MPQSREETLRILRERAEAKKRAAEPESKFEDTYLDHFEPQGAGKWGEKALEAECAEVARTPKGHRNDQLNTSAFRIGQVVGGGSLDEATARAALLKAARACGLPDDEATKTIESGIRGGVKQPRYPEPKEPPSQPNKSTTQTTQTSSGLTEPTATTDRSAWEPLDLTTWFANPPEPPERFGEGGMFYRGSLHWVAGEPESGKSVLLYNAMLDEMRDGNNVILLDEEAGVHDVMSKFTALGATTELLAERLIYLPPSGRDILHDHALLYGLTESTGATLVGLDAASAHLTLANLDEDRNKEVTAFIIKALLPLSKQLGSTVVVLDHKIKPPTGRSNGTAPVDRYARGAGAKLAKADVAFNLSVVSPFSRERDGVLKLECTKDRHGFFGRDTTWRIDVATSAGIELKVFQNPPLDQTSVHPPVSVSAPKNDTRTQVLECIKDNPGVIVLDGMAKTGVSRDTWTRHCNSLEKQGLIVRKKSGSHTAHWTAEDHKKVFPDLYKQSD